MGAIGLSLAKDPLTVSTEETEALTIIIQNHGTIVGQHPGIALTLGLHDARSFAVRAGLVHALEGDVSETLTDR